MNAETISSRQQHRLLQNFIPVCFWRDSPQRATTPSFTSFLNNTQRRITVGRTPLVEWSARRSDLYLITHNTLNRQTSMSPLGFEPTISAGKRLHTYALDRIAMGSPYTYSTEFNTSISVLMSFQNCKSSFGYVFLMFLRAFIQIPHSASLLPNIRSSVYLQVSARLTLNGFS
jgi:hypothetical protein